MAVLGKAHKGTNPRTKAFNSPQISRIRWSLRGSLPGFADVFVRWHLTVRYSATPLQFPFVSVHIITRRTSWCSFKRVHSSFSDCAQLFPTSTYTAVAPGSLVIPPLSLPRLLNPFSCSGTNSTVPFLQQSPSVNVDLVVAAQLLPTGPRPLLI